MKIDYTYLRRLRLQEQSSMSLSQLPEDFYSQVKEYVMNVKNKVGVNPNLDNMREYENLIKTLKDIIRFRLQKIVLKSTQGFDEEIPGMTREEKELFIRINQYIRQYEEEVNSLITGSEPPNINHEETFSDEHISDKTQEEQKSNEKEDDFMEIIPVQNIPAYTGLDGNIYGPFDSGERVRLPKEEAKFLINANMAKPA